MVLYAKRAQTHTHTLKWIEIITMFGHNEIIYTWFVSKGKKGRPYSVARATIHRKDEVNGWKLGICMWLLLILSTPNKRCTLNNNDKIHTITVYIAPIHLKFKRIEFIMCTHTTTSDDAVCVWCCVHNINRFVWIANISDASVYLDLSLPTNKCEAELRSECILRYYGRTYWSEFCVDQTNIQIKTT